MYSKSIFKNIRTPLPPLSRPQCIKISAAIRLEKTRKRYHNPNVKKAYDLSNLPQVDAEKLRPYHCKFEIINALPAYMNYLSMTHDVYFVTFNFRKNHHRDFYQQYFYFFRRKIDQLLNIRTRHDDISTIMILTPESKPMHHYHGFLLIHKSKAEKFAKSCVQRIVSEYVPSLKSNKDTVYLKQDILKADSIQLKETNEQLQALTKIEEQLRKDMPFRRAEEPFSRKLFQYPTIEHVKVLAAKQSLQGKKDDIRLYESSNISTYKIYPIYNLDEPFNAQMYSAKDFIRSRRFTTDDMIFEAKPNSKSHFSRLINTSCNLAKRTHDKI